MKSAERAGSCGEKREEKKSPIEGVGSSPGQGERTVIERSEDFSIPPEGRKCRPSCEYAPGGALCDTTNFSVEDFGQLAGRKLVEIGDLLNRLMDNAFHDVMLHSKSQPSGYRTNKVFPLPLSSVVIEGSRHPAFARATYRSLNLFYGEPDGGKNKSPGPACLRALKFVVSCVDEVGSWVDIFDTLSFDTFFQSKGVDYRGEEVKVPQRFSWTSLKPAMPPEVGSVILADFCTLGTKYYVEKFSDFLVPPEKRFMGRAPSVMVREEDWFEVC